MIAGDGTHYSFLATSKDDMLEWMESITSSKTLDPSPLLLHASGGAVIHTGFMSCQEFANEFPCEGSTSTARPLLQSKISDVNFCGAFSAIDYGRHWTVLRSSGLVQCLVNGKPETLFNLADCHRVKVNNPREMREGVDYGFEVENTESKFVLRADLPTEHCDWVLAIEQILKKLDHTQLLQGHRKRESGYVALKRLLLTGQQQQATNGRASQLYCFPRILDDMEDIYDPPPPATHPPPPKLRPGPRSELLQKHRSPPKELSSPLSHSGLPTTPEDNVMPLPPKDYLPPPLPPRKEAPPPIPPKALRRPPSTISSTGSYSDADDDYIMMQSTLSSTGPSPMGTPLPATPRSRSVSQSSTQPITIPNRRSAKKSILLRADSESSSCANSPPTTASSIHSDARKHSNSNSFSFHRQNSFHSLSSSSYNIMRQVSISSINSETPPLPPRNGEKRSSGYSSPVFHPSYPSPGGRLPQSNTMNGISSHHTYNGRVEGVASQSDGMTVTELQEYHRHSNGRVPAHHPISKAGSVPRRLADSYTSEGYESDSGEDLSKVSGGRREGEAGGSDRGEGGLGK